MEHPAEQPSAFSPHYKKIQMSFPREIAVPALSPFLYAANRPFHGGEMQSVAVFSPAIRPISI